MRSSGDLANGLISHTDDDGEPTLDVSHFTPTHRTPAPPKLSLPGELWLTVLETPCTFGRDVFDAVMLNLIKNPNVTSSYLFRADIIYDDASEPSLLANGAFKPSIRTAYPAAEDLRPRSLELPGYACQRTIVRRLIPRNEQVDRPLVQSCQFFQGYRERHHERLVVYTPHVDDAGSMPFYHPAVSKVAFHHQLQTLPDSSCISEPSKAQAGSISISYCLFPSTSMTPKLSRTALKLLQTVHKHGQGRLTGYQKRVHLDQIITQKRYQDTYARLKAKYGRKLSEQWVEVTDPGKHVFEHIGIAAFLIELWGDMYEAAERVEQTNAGAEQESISMEEESREAVSNHSADTPDLPDEESSGNVDPGSMTESTQRRSQVIGMPRCLSSLGAPDEDSSKAPFPGFVDIGCGNGILTYILLSEGYRGFGFDARGRKTWRTFPENIQTQLQQRLLVPSIFQDHAKRVRGWSDVKVGDAENEGIWQDGLFDPGTFIISNHADELTAWTPLLAYLNESAFIAIPCCSHNLSGARFRAPPTTKATKVIQDANRGSARLPQQLKGPERSGADGEEDPEGQCVRAECEGAHDDLRLSQAAETGSLKKTMQQKKMASAYATLCSYVTSLAEEVGFAAEKEVLRIPSTRNQSIIGRRRTVLNEDPEGLGHRKAKVVEILERELGRGIAMVAAEWVACAEKLAKKPGSGH